MIKNINTQQYTTKKNKKEVKKMTKKSLDGKELIIVKNMYYAYRF